MMSPRGRVRVLRWKIAVTLRIPVMGRARGSAAILNKASPKVNVTIHGAMVNRRECIQPHPTPQVATTSPVGPRVRKTKYQAAILILIARLATVRTVARISTRHRPLRIPVTARNQGIKAPPSLCVRRGSRRSKAKHGKNMCECMGKTIGALAVGGCATRTLGWKS